MCCWKAVLKSFLFIIDFLSSLILFLIHSDTLYCFFSLFFMLWLSFIFHQGSRGHVIGEWHPNLTCWMQHLFESKDTHTLHHVTHSVMSSENDGVPSCWQKKSSLFHLRQITISLGLDSKGLSLWNEIPAHALQIYLLFYLPGQAHGKIIPNTCRALSGTLE